MGRNGAGKSTLLRHAAGLMEPTRGRSHAAGRVALLLQNPSDYLVHETVGEEARPSALARGRALIRALAERHPRDCRGGESQRLALAIVLGDRRPAPAVVCLDEPTRGMDRAPRTQLAELLDAASAPPWWSRPTTPSSRPRSPSAWCCSPTARVIADGAAARDARRRHATSRPRRRGSSAGRRRADRRARRVALLAARRRRGDRMSWQLGAFALLALALARRLRLVRARAARRADRRAGRHAGRVRGARADRLRGAAERQADDRHRADRRLRARRRRPGSRSARWPALTSNFFFGQGPWTPWQMAGLGATGVIGAGLAARTTRGGSRPRGRWPLVCGVVGFALHRAPGRRRLGHLQRPQPRPARRLRRQGARLRLDPRRRLLGVRARVRPGADALDRSGSRGGCRSPGSPPTRRDGCPVAARSALTAGRRDAATAGAPAPRARPPALPARRPERRRRLRPAPGQPSARCTRAGRRSGLAAAGVQPGGRPARRREPARLRRGHRRSATDLGSLERTILVAARGRGCRRPASPAGDCSSASAGARRLGRRPGQPDAFAVLALRAAGVTPLGATRSAGWSHQQDRDGGFSFATAGGPSDVDDTGAALEALAGMPAIRRRCARGRSRFMRASRTATAAFPSQPGGGSNAQSTAWAVQGLIAAASRRARCTAAARPLAT